MSEPLTGADDGLTAGALLRQAREAAGLHVSTLAANLKVPVRKLEALEEDRYDLLPDAVFARALASSVCRTLKIDSGPIMQRLPQTAHPRLAQDRDGINAPFRPTGDAPRGGWFDQVSKPVAVTVGVLLLAALGLVFWPEIDDTPALAGADGVMPPGTSGAVTAAPAEPRADGGAASDPSAAATTTITAPASAPAVAAATPAAPASAPVAALPAPAAPAASAAVAAAPAASAASAPVAASGVVVFRTTGSSWIQVTDARGTAVLRRLLEAGETATADGALPLTVTVGNMQATEVQVRGQPYNLAPVSRDNVARFEVK